jgi:membrane protein implicated in regulation of membrane protease activity
MLTRLTLAALTLAFTAAGLYAWTNGWWWSVTLFTVLAFVAVCALHDAEIPRYETDTARRRAREMAERN